MVKKDKRFTVNKGNFQEIYDKGLSDWEAAKEAGCSRTTFFYWRRSQGLQAHRSTMKGATISIDMDRDLYDALMEVVDANEPLRNRSEHVRRAIAQYIDSICLQRRTESG